MQELKFLSAPSVYRKDLDTAETLYDRAAGCDALRPGEFCWWQGLANGVFAPRDAEHPTLWYRPPGAPGSPYQAPVTIHKSEQDKVGKTGTFWHWNGNREKPTLAPSIGVPENPPYHWHGHLRDGAWKSV